MDSFEKESVKVFLGVFFKVLFLTVVFSLLLAFPTMWLWNWLMPAIFGLKTLTFWESLGMTFLCSMLFGKVNIKS